MIKTQVLKYLSGAREGEKGRRKGDIRRGVIAKRAMEKSRYVMVIEGNEIRGDDPMEYFFPKELEVPLEPRGGNGSPPE